MAPVCAITYHSSSPSAERACVTRPQQGWVSSSRPLDAAGLSHSGMLFATSALKLQLEARFSKHNQQTVSSSFAILLRSAVYRLVIERAEHSHDDGLSSFYPFTGYLNTKYEYKV